MNDTPTCTDCNQLMEPGFVPDFHYSAVLQTVWHPGTPENQTFFGIKTPGVKIENSLARKIITFRCPCCGFLRSYAK